MHIHTHSHTASFGGLFVCFIGEYVYMNMYILHIHTKNYPVHVHSRLIVHVQQYNMHMSTYSLHTCTMFAEISLTVSDHSSSLSAPLLVPDP